MTEYQITRVNISLPCKVPVLPGTPITDAPLDLRTEYCAVNAWWFVGSIPTCHIHLEKVLEITGDSMLSVIEDLYEKYPDALRGGVPNETERTPWEDQYRYMEDVERELPTRQRVQRHKRRKPGGTYRTVRVKSYLRRRRSE